jgi:hypothetical protein
MDHRMLEKALHRWAYTEVKLWLDIMPTAHGKQIPHPHCRQVFSGVRWSFLFEELQYGIIQL